MEPENNDIIFEYAGTLSKYDMDAEAKDVYSQMIEKNPQNVDALVSLGDMHLKSKELCFVAP